MGKLAPLDSTGVLSKSVLSDKITPQGCIAKCLGNPSSFSTKSRYKSRFPSLIKRVKDDFLNSGN